MAPAAPLTPELVAPPAWRTVDFISDLHLSAGHPATFAAWQHYLHNTPTDAVFMLGDLFEVWVGDDAADATIISPNFEAQCADLMRHTAGRLALFFMHGNRDFLVGDALMRRCGMTLLADPTVLLFKGERWLLSHGDALCLSDSGYMRFRQQVRSPVWQKAFLAKPLSERQSIALSMRQQSQTSQQTRKEAGSTYADIDTTAARQWLQAAKAATLIHGHTHQPAEHDLGDGLKRVVLTDWDADTPNPRAEVLRLDASGLRRITLF